MDYEDQRRRAWKVYRRREREIRMSGQEKSWRDAESYAARQVMQEALRGVNARERRAKKARAMA